MSERYLRPSIIGIAGGSCSGKTKMAQTLLDRFGSDATLIRQDNYYYSIDSDTVDWARHNFDEPTSIDFDKLATDIKSIKSGKRVKTPSYDFETHKRRPQTIDVSPCPFIIVEGTMVLWHKHLRDLFAVSIFIECEENLRLSRRQMRDQRERGRELEEINAQFHGQVAPAHRAYIAPSAVHADIIIAQNTYIENCESVIDEVIAFIQDHAL